jgi:hypothetical protein
MNKTLAIIAILLIATACHRAKEKANEVISKAGETAGNSASEFVKGVGKGIDEAYGDDFDFSALKDEGLQTGKKMMADSGGRENVLSVYFIFNKDFNKEILARVVDKSGLEYGRAKKQVAGKKGEAGFFDFYFDGRTDFESKSKFIFE